MLYANTPAFIYPTFEWTDDNDYAKKSDALNEVHAMAKGDRTNYVDGGKVSSITFRRVTLDGSNGGNHLGNGYFGYSISPDYEVVGSYDAHSESGDLYYVTNENGTAKLVHSPSGTVNTKGTSVWIRKKSTSNYAAPIRTVGAKDFTDFDFDFDNEQAGISDIVADDITVEGYANDEGVYDLLGRKMGEGSLDGMPAGVYIFKGQKVYVK